MLAFNVPVSQGMSCPLGITEAREDSITAYRFCSSNAQTPIATGRLYYPKVVLQYGRFIGGQSLTPQIDELTLPFP
jgi:hypothetical protein